MKQVTFLDLLTLLFIALKLCHVINWPWWWVVSPIFIALVVGHIIKKITIWATKLNSGLQGKT